MLIKRLSCVLKISDSFSGCAVTGADVSVSVDGRHFMPQYKQDGFFVFIDLSEGDHDIEIASWKYQTEHLAVSVDYKKTSSDKIIYVMLNPGERHPAAAKAASLKGRFPEKTEFYILRARSAMKIAEDSASEGKTEIKLFDGGRGAVLPAMYLISGGKNSEFAVITGRKGDIYMLDRPLENSYQRSTEVMPLYRYTTDENGVFFACLPVSALEDDTSAAIMFFSGNKLISRKIFVSGSGITDVGTIGI